MLFVCPGENINHSPGKLYTEKGRETGGENSSSLNVLLPCSGNVHICTNLSLTFLVGFLENGMRSLTSP